MDQTTRHHFDLRFRCDFLEKKGNAFQDFFSELMQKVHPGDFIASKPWGKLGDKKNDGYLKSARILFQVYAPDKFKSAEAVAKIEEDFRGALPYWKSHFGRWVFVHNAQGLGPEVLKTILDLQSEFPDMQIETWGFEELRREFWKLSEQDLVHWFGGGPYDDSPSLRFVFDRYNEYPELRFSLANHTASRVQVSKLRAVRAASLKDERSPVASIMGPRMRFQMNLSKAGIGEPIELLGRDTVSTLVPGEADAIAVNVECQNTINLIDFEAEVVSARELATKRCYPHYLFVVRTGESGFSGEPGKGKLLEISRDQCLRALFDEDACRPAAENLEIPPRFLQELLLRGSAFICRGNLWGYFVELTNRYKGSDDWGSVLASFAEYHAMWEQVPGLQAQIEAWLTDSESVATVLPWDDQSRAVRVCMSALRRLNSEQATFLCLKILDATMGFMECRESSDDPEMTAFLGSMSVQTVRDTAFRWLFDRHPEPATHLGLILCVLSVFDANGVREVFESSGRKSFRIPDVCTSRKEREEWQQSEPIQRLCHTKLIWANKLPRIAVAAAARCGHRNLSAFVGHPDVYVRMQLGENPNLSEDLVRELARDNSLSVKRALARRESLSPDVRNLLLGTGDKIIRNWLQPKGSEG